MSDFSEDLMIECLEQDPPNLTPLLEGLKDLHRDDPETASAHAKLIRIQCAQKGFFKELVSLYLGMADWYVADRGWRKEVHRDLSQAFSDDPLQTLLLELSGLDSPRLKGKAGLLRLQFLQELKGGDYVFMKNFGFGTVTEVRHEDRRVVVDFIDRPGHELELSFAAEKMVRVDEDHLYAMKHLQAEVLDDMVKKNPAEVVRITLRSFGPTAAPQLQGILVPDILPEAKWKTFWTNARKELKKDPLVVLPAKRSEAIELLHEEKSYNVNWFTTLGQLKNMEMVLSELEDYLVAEEDISLSDDQRTIVVDRLRFVVLGALGQHDDYLVRAWLIAQSLSIPADEVDLASFLEKVKTPEGLLPIVRTLSANLTKSFLGALDSDDRDACAEVLIQVLPELEYSALNEAIQLLVDQGKEDRVASALRDVWNQWSAEVDVMFWLSQNASKITEWNYGGTPDLVSRILKVINRDYTGNRLRVRNQLRETFRKPVWLKEVLGSMDERQRRAFTQGVKDSTAWEQLDKASVLGQIVKIDGSVQDIVSGKAEEREDDVAIQARVSSFRSYKEKEAQLQKIINKDIPENSNDIARAREYGDLRENFEYKAAKDMQRVLMGRRAELENQLRDVVPSDFSEFDADVAGVATTVVIEYTGGGQDTFYILGEWDSDPDRSIIANASGMALALAGSQAGDTVTVPSETGDREASVVSIGPLPAELLAWAASEPQGATAE